jgi:hypothetical protein
MLLVARKVGGTARSCVEDVWGAGRARVSGRRVRMGSAPSRTIIALSLTTDITFVFSASFCIGTSHASTSTSATGGPLSLTPSRRRMERVARAIGEKGVIHERQFHGALGRAKARSINASEDHDGGLFPVGGAHRHRIRAVRCGDASLCVGARDAVGGGDIGSLSHDGPHHGVRKGFTGTSTGGGAGHPSMSLTA